MLRRYLSTLKVGSELFPSAHSALASSDPWCLPSLPRNGHKNNSLPPLAAQLASAVTRKDFQAGWYLFNQSHHHFNPNHLSRLLAILPSGSETAHIWWPRARQIKQSLDERRARLSSAEYAILINLAAKAGNITEVDALWLEMSELGVARDTNVWNQYIMAVCDANPRFWPWPRKRSLSYARKEANKMSRVPAVPVTMLLEQMELEGVPRDSRTYELVILALARDTEENLSACVQLVDRLWVQGDVSPGISGMTAIVSAFAFHAKLVAGYELVKRVNPSGLGSHAADRFWTQLLRQVVAQTEPRGNVPTEFFDQVWREMTEVFHYKPSLGEWSIRLEMLEWKNQFDTMLDCVPEMLRVAGGHGLAQSAVTRASTGLIRTGRALDAAKRLQVAKSLGVEPHKDLTPLLAANGASFEQLKMYEEDDDEDGFAGSSII